MSKKKVKSCTPARRATTLTTTSEFSDLAAQLGIPVILPEWEEVKAIRLKWDGIIMQIDALHRKIHCLEEEVERLEKIEQEILDEHDEAFDSYETLANNEYPQDHIDINWDTGEINTVKIPRKTKNAQRR